MTDKNPASLTSSLLARKGDAAPAHEAGAQSAESPPLSASVEGTPVATGATDDFLSREPEAIAPEPQPEGPSWDAMVDDTANTSSRWRRAPLLVLAVLLVFVLAGAAWFAANIFMDSGAPPRDTMTTADAGASKGAAKNSNGLQRASGQPLAPATSSASSDPEPRPPTPVADATPKAAAVAINPQPPSPVDPVTTDPQDAPRITNEGPASDGEKKAPAAPMISAKVEPLPPATSATKTAAPAAPPAPPSAPVKIAVPPAATPAPMAKAPEKPAQESLPPAKASIKIDPAPAATVAKPIRPAKPKPAVKMASRPTGTYAVQLSSVKSSSIARREVARLGRKHERVLAGTPLRVRTADLGSRGKVFRIQTAAVLTSAQAKRLCNRLKSRKQACFVVAR